MKIKKILTTVKGVGRFFTFLGTESKTIDVLLDCDKDDVKRGDVLRTPRQDKNHEIQSSPNNQ